MATGKRPDPRRRKTRHPHSNNFTVKCGEKHPGYKAGEMFGCYTHRTFAAQPCIYDITNGALQCPYCAAGLIPEWRGYVPIWDRDWALRHALIGEAYFETVDVIPFHAQVELSRGKNPISPLVIRQQAGMLRELPQRDPWKLEVNMLAVCLTLWKCDALTQWVEKNQPLAYASACAPNPAPEPKPASKPYTGPGGEGAKEVEYGTLVNRIASKSKNLKPSTNGDKPH